MKANVLMPFWLVECLIKVLPWMLVPRSLAAPHTCRPPWIPAHPLPPAQGDTLTSLALGTASRARHRDAPCLAWGHWVKHTKQMFRNATVTHVSLCFSCSLGVALLRGAHLRAVLGPLHMPCQIQMPGSKSPLVASLARKKNPFLLFSPQIN